MANEEGEEEKIQEVEPMPSPPQQVQEFLIESVRRTLIRRHRTPKVVPRPRLQLFRVLVQPLEEVVTGRVVVQGC